MLQSTPDYSAEIDAALATQGGHLSIGRGGFALHYRNGATLSGYGCEAIRAQCIAAGAEVWNIPGVQTTATPAERRPAP